MGAGSNGFILGVAAVGAVGWERAPNPIEEKGNPLAFAEVEPLNLWQRTIEHHDVTPVVDFAPGSAALVIAAAGAFECEGVAASLVHCEWLDSALGCGVMYSAGMGNQPAQQL